MSHTHSNISLFQKLESLIDSIDSNNDLSLLKEIQYAEELMDLFILSPLELSMLALIATKSPKIKEINEPNLIQFFAQGNTKRSDIILSLKKLNRKKYIKRGHGQRKATFELETSYSCLLENNDYESIKALNEEGLLPFLKMIFKTSNYENSRSLFFNQWDEMDEAEDLVEHVVKENASLACVKYAHKFLNVAPFYIHELFYLTIARRILIDDNTCPAEFLGNQKIPVWNRKSFLNNQIANREWAPVEHGLFDIIGNNFIDSNLEICLTDKGLQELCPELSEDIQKGLLEGNSVTVAHKKPEEIGEIPLIFDTETQRLITPIRKSMEPEIRDKIRERFKHRKLGLTALLYGYPGTGKTEFCYQLAREFDMPIYEVNVAQIQDKWVGESEKNARKLFQEYLKLKKQTKRECILLFNEADALFSRRLDVHTSVDTMNNALKNIFLEEMERFDGILLATTNLTGNLDTAFERRFLFKVFFNKPELETRSKIWQLYFTELTETEAHDLAIKFDFTPGEIANVQVKYEIERIIGNNTPILELISEICKEEKIKSAGSQFGKKVGFN
jgi:hypothetical protein